MTRKLIAWVAAIPLLILLTLALFCAASSSTPLSSQDYVVYSALIQHRFANGDSHFVANEAHPLLIRRHTQALRNAPFQFLVFSALVEDGGLRGAPRHLKRNEVARSWLESPLEQRFDLEFPYRLVDEGSKEVSGQNFEPYLTLGRIGFNSDATTALVSYGFTCGLCGGGGYMILKRGGNGWEVVKDVQQWSS